MTGRLARVDRSYSAKGHYRTRYILETLAQILSLLQKENDPASLRSWCAKCRRDSRDSRELSICNCNFLASTRAISLDFALVFIQLAIWIQTQVQNYWCEQKYGRNLGMKYIWFPHTTDFCQVRRELPQLKWCNAEKCIQKLLYGSPTRIYEVRMFLYWEEVHSEVIKISSSWARA